MNCTVPAVYDAGVFRPLTPVDLAQGTPVEVRLPITLSEPATHELSPADLARQRVAIERWLCEIARLPEEGPDDGFSGRDHDKVLYGKP